MKIPGNLIMISAPSGTGKTSLVTALRQKLPHLRKSISHTTRSARNGEIDGVHYHFVDEDKFSQMLQKHMFLEHAQVFGNYYGTSKEWVLSTLQQGNDVILEIDWQGAQQIRKQIEDVVSIFILPPSEKTLLERLKARNLDDAKVIASRIQEAKNEVAHCTEYEYLVVNDDFATAIEQLGAIIQAAKLRTYKQQLAYKELFLQFEGKA